MLPSWRKHTRAVLCPDRVILIRIATGLRPHVAAKELVLCDVKEGAAWRGAVEALRAALMQPSWSVAGDATLVLSNHFVRYLLIPWSAELTGEDEERAWVARQFAAVYGEAASRFEYRWSADAPDASCLASAIDRDLLTAVQSAFSGSASRLRSVQPYFMTAFNRWRSSMRGSLQWFVLGEPGHVCIGSVERNRWCTFRARKTGADWTAEVPLVLEREMLMAGADAGGEILLHFAGRPESELLRMVRPPARALSTRSLSGYSPLAEPAYAMAFSGAA